jgi:hypothetical protein
MGPVFLPGPKNRFHSVGVPFADGMDLGRQTSPGTLSSIWSSEDSAPDPLSVSLVSTADSTPRCVLAAELPVWSGRVFHHSLKMEMSNSMPTRGLIPRNAPSGRLHPCR